MRSNVHNITTVNFQGGVHAEETYGTSVVAAAAASINLTGDSFSRVGIYGTPVLASALQ